MLSKKAKYALQAIILLAERHGGPPTLIAELAESGRMPRKFLELILLELRKHGLLVSKTGKGGGYALGRTPAEITMGEVVRIIDGPLAPIPCVSKMAYRRCTECADERTCGIRLVMKDVRDGIAGILDNTTFANVLERMEKARKKA